MSDYNDPNRFDKYGNPIPGTANVYDPDASTGRAPYVLLGLLVLIGIVGGALYFNGGSHTGATRAPDVASAPGIARPMTPSATPAIPPAAPDTTTTSPAPAAPAMTPAAPAAPSQQ